MSWPTTPVRAKRGRSVNSVWAIQLGSRLSWRWSAGVICHSPKLAAFAAQIGPLDRFARLRRSPLTDVRIRGPWQVFV